MEHSTLTGILDNRLNQLFSNLYEDVRDDISVLRNDANSEKYTFLKSPIELTRRIFPELSLADQQSEEYQKMARDKMTEWANEYSIGKDNKGRDIPILKKQDLNKLFNTGTVTFELLIRAMFVLKKNIPDRFTEKDGGEMLIKLGLDPFSSRKSEDVIDFYCLKQDLPYSAVLEMKEEYNTTESKEISSKLNTVLIMNKFMINAPSDPSEFLAGLITEKPNFDGYSHTSFIKYAEYKYRLNAEIYNFFINQNYETDEFSEDADLKVLNYISREANKLDYEINLEKAVVQKDEDGNDSIVDYKQKLLKNKVLLKYIFTGIPSANYGAGGNVRQNYSQKDSLLSPDIQLFLNNIEDIMNSCDNALNEIINALASNSDYVN